MDNPTYVRITTPSENPGSWYNDQFFTGAIFEVVADNSKTSGRWIVKGGSINGAPRSIQKSDCEVVALPHLNGQEKEDANWKRGYTLGFDRGFKQAQKNLSVLEEGQHLISTEQLKQLYNCASEYREQEAYELVMQIAPKVFQPEKTYKIGQRYEAIGQEYLLAQCDAYHICLINIETGSFWRKPVKVKSILNITEDEFKEIAGDLHKVTLLPDTTDSMV